MHIGGRGTAATSGWVSLFSPPPPRHIQWNLCEPVQIIEYYVRTNFTHTMLTFYGTFKCYLVWDSVSLKAGLLDQTNHWPIKP
jgi:hypothetical protein